MINLFSVNMAMLQRLSEFVKSYKFLSSNPKNWNKFFIFHDVCSVLLDFLHSVSPKIVWLWAYLDLFNESSNVLLFDKLPKNTDTIDEGGQGSKGQIIIMELWWMNTVCVYQLGPCSMLWTSVNICKPNQSRIILQLLNRCMFCWSRAINFNVLFIWIYNMEDYFDNCLTYAQLLGLLEISQAIIEEHC